ncbi:hypothetical protein [Clostridium estertheticum]|nr:hypothetical protein [Clostridium estertheticum]
MITAQGVAFIDFAIEICDWFDLLKMKRGEVISLKILRDYK